ncbi:MAG: MATE family efflux transporter [Clostridia bacterium]
MQIINIGVNLMDTIMLGSFGEIQLSASSLANQYYFIFHILCLGIGGGVAVMTAKYWGAKDKDSIIRTLTLMYRICTAIAIIFSVLTLVFPYQIMVFYTNDAAVIENGVKYLQIMLLTSTILHQRQKKLLSNLCLQLHLLWFSKPYNLS